MSLRIGTNVGSITAQRHLTQSERDVDHASRELASGSRLNDASDDAAAYAIAETLRAQAAGLDQARRNADDAGGLIQVAEGGLNEQNNILMRLRELSIQSASDTVGDSEREFLDTEFQQLTQEFDRIATTTRYGNKSLLTGATPELEFHLGSGSGSSDVVTYKSNSDTRSSALGLDSLSVSSKSDAKSGINTIDDALNKVSKVRSGFGAIQSRLQIASNNLSLQSENVKSARSRIADTDVASAVTQLTRGKIMSDFGTAVLAQANQQPYGALKLLG